MLCAKSSPQKNALNMHVKPTATILKGLLQFSIPVSGILLGEFSRSVVRAKYRTTKKPKGMGIKLIDCASNTRAEVEPRLRKKYHLPGKHS
jgi:hypothetical protein